MNDPVNHPSHYTTGRIECIDFITDKQLNFCRGNAVKYIVRAGKKDPDKEIEDLEKAAWYLNREIADLKKEKEPMKVFVSQPMNGKTDEDIKAERERAIGRIMEKWPNAEIIDSYFTDDQPSDGNIPLKYLARSLERMADADVVWFCPGWEHARGCAIENDCAIEYGLDVVEDYTEG